MKQLAVEYGITPQALSKLCDELDISKPGYGYWTLRGMGRPVEKPFLSLAARQADELITIEPVAQRQRKSPVIAEAKPIDRTPRTRNVNADRDIAKAEPQRDVPMVTVHSKRGARRYRYYAAKDGSRGRSGPLPRLSRIAMGVIDDFVLAEAPHRLRADFLADAEPATRIREALLRVQITEEAVLLRLRPEASTSRMEQLPGRVVRTDDAVEVTIPVVVKSRQGAVLLEPPHAPDIAGRIDRALVRAVALSRSWADRLARGEATSLKALAHAEGYCNHYAARLLPLAWLAPDLVEQILSGRQPRALSLGALVAEVLPMDWEAQRRLFATCGRKGR